jgi:hypothetical protein
MCVCAKALHVECAANRCMCACFCCKCACCCCMCVCPAFLHSVFFAHQVPVSLHLLGCCHWRLWVWGCGCAWVWGCVGPWRDAWRGAETVHSDCERADTKSGPLDPVPSHPRRQFPLSLSLSTSLPPHPCFVCARARICAYMYIYMHAISVCCRFGLCGYLLGYLCIILTYVHLRTFCSPLPLPPVANSACTFVPPPFSRAH